MSSLPEELDFSKRREATPERMNLAMAYLLGRLRAVEAVKPDVDRVLDDLRAFGLDRVAQALTPAFGQVEGFADQLREMIDELVINAAIPAQTIAFNRQQPDEAGSIFRRLINLPRPLDLRDSDGTDAGVNMVLGLNNGTHPNGPPDKPVYNNSVIYWGLNCDNNYLPENPALPSASYRIESQYTQGGEVFAVEIHAGSVFSSDTRTEYRAITAFVPALASHWQEYSSVGARGAKHVQWDGLVDSRIVSDFTGGAGGGVVDYYEGAATGQGHAFLRFYTNNRTVIRQINAAGTDFLDHLHFNANDMLQTNAGASLQLGGPARVSNVLGTRAMLVFNEAGGLTANGYMACLISGTAVVGTVNGYYAVAYASVKVEDQTINATPGGKAGAKLRTSAGDIYWESRDETNARQFTLIYYAATNTYRLDNAQQGGQFATKYAWSVEGTNFQVSFGYPPVLPAFAVAGLPAPATAGAGAQAFCTNEAGGAVPVFSDGANWRRVTDRAIAA